MRVLSHLPLPLSLLPPLLLMMLMLLLLLLLLRPECCRDQRVSVLGRLAYASQEPWIQSGTLRENILFGRAMEQARYGKVLMAFEER